MAAHNAYESSEHLAQTAAFDALSDHGDLGMFAANEGRIYDKNNSHSSRHDILHPSPAVSGHRSGSASQGRHGSRRFENTKQQEFDQDARHDSQTGVRRNSEQTPTFETYNEYDSHPRSNAVQSASSARLRPSGKAGQDHRSQDDTNQEHVRPHRSVAHSGNEHDTPRGSVRASHAALNDLPDSMGRNSPAHSRLVAQSSALPKSRNMQSHERAGHSPKPHTLHHRSQVSQGHHADNQHAPPAYHQHAAADQHPAFADQDSDDPLRHHPQHHSQRLNPHHAGWAPHAHIARPPRPEKHHTHHQDVPPYAAHWPANPYAMHQQHHAPAGFTHCSKLTSYTAQGQPRRDGESVLRGWGQGEALRKGEIGVVKGADGRKAFVRKRR